MFERNEWRINMAVLVAYFSAEGKTAQIAKEYAEKIGAEVFEIVPETKYTKADINYLNPISRCNREQIGKKNVPISGRIDGFEKYDTVYIGFPIWYGQAPRVVHTFAQSYDWTGKTVHAFATSVSSGIGKTAEKLAPSLKGAASVDAKLVHNVNEI